MKKIKLRSFSFLGILFLCISYANAGGKWTKKSNFGGEKRYEAVGFSIGNKGYVGTGSKTETISQNLKSKPQDLFKDFWEYDPEKDTWTQKADFPGTPRERAVGFSIGTKGYIGTGYDGVSKAKCTKDFYEYDPSANKWMKKAELEGRQRFDAIGFSVGNKGYIGLAAGYDLWEYDPATDKWTKKAGLPVFAMQVEFVGFSAFSVGSKGYVGIGVKRKFVSSSPNGDVNNDSYFDNFYEYDPATDKWTRKADFPGEKRHQSSCFSIGSKGYVAGGDDIIHPRADLWEYDPASNKWTKKDNHDALKRHRAIAFTINNKGYIGTGRTANGTDDNDFWEWSE